MRFRKGDMLELSVLDTAEDDACVSKMPDGMVVFVRGLVTPGDVVRASVSKIKKNYLEARLEEVIQPSPDRVDPVCSHYGICGGCKWQHVRYDRQLDFKRKVVEDALHRLGGFIDLTVAGIIGVESPYHYRNKVEFTFSDERFVLEDEFAVPEEDRAKPSDFALGFHRRGCFHKIIDIDTCHIATELSNTVLTLSRQFFLEHRRPSYSTITHEGFLRNLVVRHAGTTGELMVNLVTSSHDPELMKMFTAHMVNGLQGQLTTLVNSTTTRMNLVAYGQECHILQGPGFIKEILDGLTFMVSPNSFFQTNSAQAIKLYRTVAEMAEVKSSDILFDLYCGTGSITMFAGRNAKKAIGFELEASAVADAVKNAELNNMSHCEFIATDMRHLHDVMTGVGCRPDVVITDPPRAGMHADAVETLRSLAPRRIVYVSCHPGSLARDAKALCEGDMYKLTKVQPVDLFPHTFHIESVACLERVG